MKELIETTRSGVTRLVQESEELTIQYALQKRKAEPLVFGVPDAGLILQTLRKVDWTKWRGTSEMTCEGLASNSLGEREREREREREMRQECDPAGERSFQGVGASPRPERLWLECVRNQLQYGSRDGARRWTAWTSLIYGPW